MYFFQVIVNYKKSTKFRIFQQDNMEVKIARGLVQGGERGKAQIVNAICADTGYW